MTGKPATDYPRVFDLIAAGAVDMGRLVTATVGLEDITSVFQRMEIVLKGSASRSSTASERRRRRGLVQSSDSSPSATKIRCRSSS